MWREWQLVDSFCPTGGFAHSLGLEAMLQEKLLDHPFSLDAFLSSTLHQTANLSMPIVTSAHSAASLSSPEEILEELERLNNETSALFSNHVATKASVAQGNAMLRLAQAIYPSFLNTRLDLNTLLGDIRKKSREKSLHGHKGMHQTVIFGVVCGMLDIESGTAQKMFLYCCMRDAVSAATRLNLIGPTQASKMLMQMEEEVEEVWRQKKDRLIADAYTSAPVLDLVQNMHDQLYTRIFNS